MGAELHQINCANTRKNTGFGGCNVDWKIIAGAFLFDGPVSFTRAQLAELQETLQAMAWQDSKTGRCYPIANFLNPADSTDDPTIQTFTDGSKAKVRDGVADWMFQFTAGGYCLLQALRTHIGNGSEWVIFYDKENKLLGYNLNGELAAIPLQIFDALPWKMNTGSEVAKYAVHFVFDVTYINDFGEYAKADFPLQNIVGLQDIKLQILGFNHATGVASVNVITECGGSNLYSQYSAQLIASLWNAQNSDTGATIAILTVTPEAGSQTFNVGIKTTDVNYPTNSDINLFLSAPSLLSTAGLPGYECEVATLEVISS